MKKLSKNIKTCFKKVRVSDKPNMEIEELFLKRKQLRNKTEGESITKLKEIESKTLVINRRIITVYVSYIYYLLNC